MTMEYDTRHEAAKKKKKVHALEVGIPRGPFL